MMLIFTILASIGYSTKCVGVEGDHVVAVKNLQGIVTPANVAFEKALTKDQVLAAIAPFLGMGAMPATGGPGE